MLLDGPCSGLGLRPRLIHRTTLHELAQARRSTLGRQADCAVKHLLRSSRSLHWACRLDLEKGDSCREECDMVANLT